LSRHVHPRADLVDSPEDWFHQRGLPREWLTLEVAGDAKSQPWEADQRQSLTE
jgi:hypothetical protein